MKKTCNLSSYNFNLIASKKFGRENWCLGLVRLFIRNSFLGQQCKVDVWAEGEGGDWQWFSLSLYLSLHSLFVIMFVVVL